MPNKRNRSIHPVADDGYAERRRRIIELLENDISYTCEEMGEIMQVDEKQIIQDLQRVYIDTAETPDKKKFVYRRMIAIIQRFPDISYSSGSRETGMDKATWKQRAVRLIRNNKIPQEYILNKPDFTNAGMLEARPKKHMFQDIPGIVTNADGSIDDTYRPKHADTQKAPVERDVIPTTLDNDAHHDVADLLEKVTQTTDASIPIDDLIGTEEVMQRLWVTVITAVVGGKLKPRNFTEAKQLLLLMMEYMNAIDERKQREREIDVFHPYTEASEDDIELWIRQAIDVSLYLKQQRKVDMQHIELIRKDLIDVFEIEKQTDYGAEDVSDNNNQQTNEVFT